MIRRLWKTLTGKGGAKAINASNQTAKEKKLAAFDKVWDEKLKAGKIVEAVRADESVSAGNEEPLKKSTPKKKAASKKETK